MLAMMTLRVNSISSSADIAAVSADDGVGLCWTEPHSGLKLDRCRTVEWDGTTNAFEVAAAAKTMVIACLLIILFIIGCWDVCIKSI